MSKQRLLRDSMLAAVAVPLILRAQEKPLSIKGTVSTGYYNSITSGEANQSLSFAPLGARFEIGGYYVSPDLVSFFVQPEVNLGPQASDAGFQGGNGIKLSVTFLRKSIAPVTFRYSNLQVQDAFFGSLSQISGYTLKNRNKDLGLTWELKPHGLPETTFDWGTNSVDSKSGTAAVADYQSEGSHFNVDSKFERWGWDLRGFARRHRQASDLLQPVNGGTEVRSLRETALQYQGSARRSFLGDSELSIDAGSQSTSTLLFTMPIDLSSRYASASVRLAQRRRWKSVFRAAYSSNMASQLLERAASALTGPGVIVPDGNVLTPFSHGMSNLMLNGLTSAALGHGVGVYGSVERTSLFAASQESPLNSSYFTTSAGLTYAHRFGWGSLSGEYAREFGAGSLIGQSGTIQGQHYILTAQHGASGGLQFDTTIHGNDQSVDTVQPISNRSFSAEASVADQMAGNFSARIGGGWQWGAIVNSANEFRTNGYTARAGIDHPRVQINGSLNTTLSNSLPFYGDLIGDLGLGTEVSIPLQAIPSSYRALSLSAHSNPMRKVELSASWMRSSQRLNGYLGNTFEIVNVFATYHFRRIQVEMGYIRFNQLFLLYPNTLRERFYIRVVRNVRIL